MRAASTAPHKLKSNDGDWDSSSDSDSEGENDDVPVMSEEERREWRNKIRQVIDRNPDADEETDPLLKKRMMQKLLADYPLVVEEEDPDWPEDADGWGFNLGQFFDKITIKNVKKDKGDDDNYDNYDSEDEIVWQDDNYIRPIKDIKTAEWEDTVLKDISPLIVLVHNRYKRSVLFVTAWFLHCSFINLYLFIFYLPLFTMFLFHLDEIEAPL